jgi:hypothetical protein
MSNMLPNEKAKAIIFLVLITTATIAGLFVTN